MHSERSFSDVKFTYHLLFTICIASTLPRFSKAIRFTEIKSPTARQHINLSEIRFYVMNINMKQIHRKIVRRYHIYQIFWLSGSAADLYSQGARLESRPTHRLFCCFYCDLPHTSRQITKESVYYATTAFFKILSHLSVTVDSISLLCWQCR